MAKRKPEEPKGGAPEWMNTFSDMMTLLLCFFVLLFASSTLDAEKFQAIAASMNSAIGILNSGTVIGERTSLGSGIAQLPQVDKAMLTSRDELKEKTNQELKKMASDFKTYFAENNLSEMIEVTQTDSTVNITFKEGILFDSGSAILRPEAVAVLNQFGDQLLKYPDNDIKIEGHTDNRPIKTLEFKSNWELSTGRASSVARYYIEQKGFAPDRFSAEGFSQYRPIESNETAEGRAKNRRVEMHIVSRYHSTSTNA